MANSSFSTQLKKKKRQTAYQKRKEKKRKENGKQQRVVHEPNIMTTVHNFVILLKTVRQCLHLTKK